MKVLLVLGLLISHSAWALETGKPAPEFVARSSEGKLVKLSELRGKIVVLEWLNYGCPFVTKHYGAGNMQSLQQEFTGKGVTWLSVISSAEGKQGYRTSEQAEKDRKEHASKASAVILDSKGELGKLFGAKTTPHMYVIDAKGVLKYQGAIDDHPSADPATIKGAHNYVRDALEAVLAGKVPAQGETKSYGCSVKYY